MHLCHNETMHYLASTSSVERIRKEEFDWLTGCELATGDVVQMQEAMVQLNALADEAKKRLGLDKGEK